MSGTDLIPLEMLKRLSPFSTISESQLPEIRKKGSLVTHDKGKILFKRGEIAADLVYLIQGSVDLADASFEIRPVRSGTDESKTPLCSEDRRSVTAVTTHPCRVFVIPKDYVDLVLTWDEAGNYIVSEVEDEGDWMTSLLSSAMFSAVPPANIQQLFARFEEVRMKTGDNVIKQGDPGDYFYVLKSGHCRITRRLSQDGQVKEVSLAEIGPGDVFGEDALIGDAPRNATVTIPITIKNVNDAPIINAPAMLEVRGEEPLPISMTDPDSDVLSLSLRASHGALRWAGGDAASVLEASGSVERLAERLRGVP